MLKMVSQSAFLPLVAQRVRKQTLSAHTIAGLNTLSTSKIEEQLKHSERDTFSAFQRH